MNFKRYLWNYKQIIRLGLPIVVGQAGLIIVGFADNIMVGRYSTEALSAASFVNNTFNMAVMACLGFAYGITPLVGALFGQRNTEGIGSLMRSAQAINIIYTLAVTAAMGVLYLNLDRLGQPEELLPLIRPYYLLFLCGLLPMTVYNVWAQCSYGMNFTKMPMWIILGANLLNVGGNYLLIYGNCGFPELGLFGAGIATLVSRCACALIILVIFMTGRHFADVRAGFRPARLRSAKFRLLLRTSLPVSMQLFMETAAFSGAAIFVGWIGAIELAAFQVMVIIGTLGFCFYYSLGAATSVLVANAAGIGDRAKMRRIGFAGYHLTLLMALCASAIFVFAGRWLIGMFTHDEAVIAVAMTLIPPLLCYQLGDATQVNFANALRGTSKVLPMLWIAFVSYLLLGLPSTYVLAFPLGGGIIGVFYSFSVSLFLAGGLFFYYFMKYTRKSE